MEMIEVKTAELIGPALDWAVAKSLGLNAQHSNNVGGLSVAVPYSREDVDVWHPSIDWIQGGPLIDEFMIGFGVYSDAYLAVIGVNEISGAELGRTHLIAACRAIVAAKLGDTVSVPRELMQ